MTTITSAKLGLVRFRTLFAVTEPKAQVLMFRYCDEPPRRGSHKSAQGNALGNPLIKPTTALKGRNNLLSGIAWFHQMSRRFRASKLHDARTLRRVTKSPRALPWADMFGPVGAESNTRNIKVRKGGKGRRHHRSRARKTLLRRSTARPDQPQLLVIPASPSRERWDRINSPAVATESGRDPVRRSSEESNLELPADSLDRIMAFNSARATKPIK